MKVSQPCWPGTSPSGRRSANETHEVSDLYEPGPDHAIETIIIVLIILWLLGWQAFTVGTRSICSWS